MVEAIDRRLAGILVAHFNRFLPMTELPPRTERFFADAGGNSV